MMLLSAQEYDRAADIRVAENDAMRGLFRDSASHITDAGLAGALAAAATTRDDSLKVSALDAANAELRRLLIRLQTYAEEQELKELDRRIWDLLKVSAKSRLLRLA